MISIFQYHSTNLKPKPKAQPLGRITQNKTQQIHNSTTPESPYPIIQHADVTLNINRTEQYT